MELINRLRSDFSEFGFAPNPTFQWSPESKTIGYTDNMDKPASQWALLHEVSHALLGHNKFSNDFSLLKQEAEAWHKATQLAKLYDVYIDHDYIEDCLDTYRNWLYSRSSCPQCMCACLQTNTNNTYTCHNCGNSWRVSKQRFCRPYRRSTEVITHN